MLRPHPLGPVPDDTAYVAHALFAQGHPSLRRADERGDLVRDALFAPLFPPQGQPALAPGRLARVTILQCAEGLSDRQAAPALRTRIAWTDGARREVRDRGFDGAVLSAVRRRRRDGAAETLLRDHLLAGCRQRHLRRVRGRHRTDSTHVLAAVRALNRLALVAETMRHALGRLAVVAPAWIPPQRRPEWVERDARRADDMRLPTGQEARTTLAVASGAHGYSVLSAAYGPQAPTWIRQVPASATRRRVWVPHVSATDELPPWRTEPQGLPSSCVFIRAPDAPDAPDAHDAHDAQTTTTPPWIGDKIPVTQTCEEDVPGLMPHVARTPGPTADGDVTPTIHARLQDKEVRPAIHLGDTGYLAGPLVADSPRV